MSETAAPLQIPNRALFKAAEVCELVQVQPYVLRSWEAEFPNLGVAKAAGAARVYRRADVERVLRIKHLLLVEGLTLAGARRKIEEDTAPVAADVPEIDTLIGANARQRLTEVKRGLRSILDLLGGSGSGEFALMPPRANGGRVASRVSAGGGVRASGAGVASGFSRTPDRSGPAPRTKSPSKSGHSSRPKRSA